MKQEDALKLAPGSQELKNEIAERVRQRDEMVGWLYKSIIENEIHELILRFNEVPLPPMSELEKTNKIVEVKNSIYSHLAPYFDKIIAKATRKMNCNHQWKSFISHYECTICEAVVDPIDIELVGMVEELIKLNK